MLLRFVIPTLFHLAPPPSPVAPDTTRYPVLNHGRLAGEMTVIRDGSNVVVRYIYTDRNRGQRLEGRYTLSATGDLVALESRAIGPDGVAGQPTFTYQVKGDSARWTGPAGARKVRPGGHSAGGF